MACKQCLSNVEKSVSKFSFCGELISVLCLFSEISTKCRFKLLIGLQFSSTRSTIIIFIHSRFVLLENECFFQPLVKTLIQNKFWILIVKDRGKKEKFICFECFPFFKVEIFPLKLGKFS